MEPIRETTVELELAKVSQDRELQEKLEQMKGLLEAERQRYNEIFVRLESAMAEVRDLTMTIRLLTRDRVALQRRVNG
jgi:DNA-binding transcriptional regulator GbsR (MarR family)